MAAVGTHRHAPHPILMPGQSMNLRAGFEVPDRDSLVSGPRDNTAPVGAHRHGTHRAFMPGEAVDWRAGFEVPDRHGVVLGPRDDSAPIGAHRHGSHLLLMPDEPADRRAGFKVPDRHGVVPGPRDDSAPIGAHRHGSHLVLMLGEDSHEGGRFTKGSPTQDEGRLSEFSEPTFGAFGQAGLPQSQGTEVELLSEAVGLERVIPLPKTMAFALEDTKHRAQVRAGPVIEPRGKLQGRRKRVMEPVGALGPEDFLESRELLE